MVSNERERRERENTHMRTCVGHRMPQMRARAKDEGEGHARGCHSRASEREGTQDSLTSFSLAKLISYSISQRAPKIPEVRVRTSGSGSCKMSDPDPSKGSGPVIFTNLNPNLGFGPCVNPVRRVREPDRGQSRYR